jgi:hypothetical protein
MFEDIVMTIEEGQPGSNPEQAGFKPVKVARLSLGAGAEHQAECSRNCHNSESTTVNDINIQRTPRENKMNEARVVMVPVDDIDPNDYNSNELNEEQVQVYLEYVKRTGWLPKVLTVRPKTVWFDETDNEGNHKSTAILRAELIDGEQSLKVAKMAGLQDVMCVLLEVAESEALRENHIRNQRGKINPVKEGRKYQRMMKLRSLMPSWARQAPWRPAQGRQPGDTLRRGRRQARRVCPWARTDRDCLAVGRQGQAVPESPGPQPLARRVP